jgi:hypothetical protein
MPDATGIIMWGWLPNLQRVGNPLLRGASLVIDGLW